MRVDMVPVIDYEEVLKALKLEDINDFWFYSRSNNYDGYFWVSTDEDAIADLEADITDEKNSMEKWGWEPDEALIKHLNNDIELIRLLRLMGYEDGVLIYVWF